MCWGALSRVLLRFIPSLFLHQRDWPPGVAKHALSKFASVYRTDDFNPESPVWKIIEVFCREIYADREDLILGRFVLNLIWAVEISSNKKIIAKSWNNWNISDDTVTAEIQSLYARSKMIIFSAAGNLSCIVIRGLSYVSVIFYLGQVLKFFHLSELQSCFRLTKVLLSFVTNQKKRPKKGPKRGPKMTTKSRKII